MSEPEENPTEKPAHPHGGPPGQTGEHPEHPHGGPPGQNKPDEEADEETDEGEPQVEQPDEPA